MQTWRETAIRGLDALGVFGLCVLFVGLGISEAAKSVGLALAVFGYVGRLVLGHVPARHGRPQLLALGAFVLAAVASFVLAEPGFGRPRELLTMAVTIVAFPLVLDACRRPSRRVLFAVAILTGAAAAALLGYASHMAGPYRRLVLGSVENAVVAAEYLAATMAFGLPILFAERRSPVVGPLAAFAVGSIVVALGMTLSRGPLVGAATGGLVAISTAFRRRFVLAALATVVVGVWALAVWNPSARIVSDELLETRAAHSRVTAWREGADKWLERPLVGHGPGSYPLLGIHYDDGVHVPEHQNNAHNALLNTAAELGVIGCGTLALFLVLGIRGIVLSMRAARWWLERAVMGGCLAGSVALLAAGVLSVSIDAEPGILLFSFLALGTGGDSGSATSTGGS